MTRARLGALLGVCALVWIPASTVPSRADLAAAKEAYVFLVEGVALPDLLPIPGGGVALLSGGADLPGRLRSLARDPAVHVVDLGSLEGPGTGDAAVPVVDGDRLLRAWDAIRAELRASRATRVLLVIASTTPPSGYPAPVTPIALAAGDPATLLPAGPGPVAVVGSELHALTSDSTRRTGVVVGADVVPTVRAFLGLPEGDDGFPIRSTDDPWPFELHERYLAQRQLYVPIGTAAALYLTAAGLLGVAFLVTRRRVPQGWRRVAAWGTLSVPMLATGMLAAGHLPDLSYATAVPMIAIVTVFGTMAFSPLERADPTLIPAGIGAAVLGLGVVEAILGWSGMLTPLLGGSQLDGGRFYGLPNVAIGLLVGAALWVAQRLRTRDGFVLLCLLGLFAGLPFVGANLGGAVTAFAAAGLWLAVRRRERLGAWRGAGVALGVTAVGAAVILVAHAISPVQTHVSRLEQSGGGVGGILDKVGDRLQVGFDLIARSPAALVPVLGLPVVLFFVLRPPAVIAATFERWPAWRDAVLVTILAGIVAYVVNDSGPAAAGLAFGLGLGGMLAVSLLAVRGKMEGP